MKRPTHLMLIAAVAIAANACVGSSPTEPNAKAQADPAIVGTWRGTYPLGEIALRVYGEPTLFANMSGDVILTLNTGELAIYNFDGYGLVSDFRGNFKSGYDWVEFHGELVNPTTLKLRWNTANAKFVKFFGGPTEVTLSR